MASSNNQADALQQELFTAFDDIAVEVQRRERELFSERRLCEKLNVRLKDLDVEEANVLEQTNVLFAKREENFKKEVDVQAALDCITKTLQLEKERHAGLQHQLDRANSKAVEQNIRLKAKEEKYRAVWDSYKAIYESMPLVMEVNRMTNLVIHEKIKLMQANYELRLAHNKIVQMDKINERAKKVEVVKLAEVLCEKAASESLVAEMQRQMLELQASVGRGMERKQQLLVRPTAKRISDPAQATLPIATVAAMPVASCTGQDSSLLNLRSVPQVPSLASVYSRQASLEIVRARYAKRSWPGADESVFSSNESPSKLLVTETNSVIEKMNFALPDSQQPRESPSNANGIEYSPEAMSCDVPMQLKCTSQDDHNAREIAKESGVADSPKMGQSSVSMAHSSQRSNPTAIPMNGDDPQAQELSTHQREAENLSSSYLQGNRASALQVRIENSYREPTVTIDQSSLVLSAKSKLDVVMTVRAGTRTAPDQRPIIPGIPLQESSVDEKMAEVAPQPPEEPVSPFTPGTIMREQTSTLGMSASQTEVLDRNAATGSSGSDPEQGADGDNNMDGGFCLSQDAFLGSQDELGCTQQSYSDRTSRVEYLKKLRQSPEFHYAPRLMFNRQETGSQENGSSSPYFQALVSEANACREKVEASFQGSEKQDCGHPKELIAQLTQNQQPSNQQIPMQQSQVKQLSNQTMQGQQPQVQQFPNQTLRGQSQQFGNFGATQQGSLAPTSMEGLAVMQLTRGHQDQLDDIPTAHTAAQMSEQNKHHNQNDFQQTGILVGSQGNGIAQPTVQFGSQGNGTAHATSQSGDHGNGTARATSQFGSQGNGTAPATSHFGSQGNGTTPATSHFGGQENNISTLTGQFESHENANAQTASQLQHENTTLPSSSQAMSQCSEWCTPKQPLSQGTDYLQTPRHSQGDSVQMEMGGGNFGDSPLSAFPTPGEALTAGTRGPAMPDVHDSSSNESFQFMSPSCSPPPSQPAAGFGFMGAAPQQQVSMFGPPVGAPNGGSNVQEKPRSEAFNFNFSSNSNNPSIFKLF